MPFHRRQGKALIVDGIGRKLGCGRTFQPQVKLAHDHPFEMGDDIHWAEAARSRRQHFDGARSKVKGVDVLAEGPFDAGSQDFDRHLFAGFGDGRLVNLGK